MTKYIVIEIQTNGDGTIGNIVTAFDERNAAESEFHTVLASAAISVLPCHAAVLMTNEGFVIDSKSYKHETAAEAESEE